MKKDYTKLIYKTAWSFQNTTGIDYDEFVSLGLMVWAECLSKYDRTKNVPFYSYLKQALYYDFSLFYKKTRRKHELDEKVKSLPVIKPVKMERLYDFKEKLNHLSKTSQKIVKAIFNGEIENTTTLRKYHIKNYFRKLGITHLKINQCFNEIKAIL